MTPDLTDDDKAILIELMRQTIERDRFAFSLRARSFKGDPGKARSTGPAAGTAPIRPRHQVSRAWRSEKKGDGNGSVIAIRIFSRFIRGLLTRMYPSNI